MVYVVLDESSDACNFKNFLQSLKIKLPTKGLKEN